MIKSIIILLCVFPTIVFGQFGTSEFYSGFKTAIGMGMNTYTYRSTLDGTSVDLPKTVQVDVGSGITPELVLGFKLVENVYVESSLSYTLNSDFYTTSSGSTTNEQGYSYNRFNLQLNGKYYVTVNQGFVLDFSGGFAYSIPTELVVKVSGITEIVDYAGSLGFQAGFGGNFIVGDFCFNTGIRYRLERFTLKPDQTLPFLFENVNPNFSEISSNGIDLVFSVQYNF